MATANGTMERRRTRLHAGPALRDLSRPDLRPREWPGVRRTIIPDLEQHMSEFVGPGPVALVFRGVQGGPWSRSNFNKMLAWPSAVRSLIGAEGLRRGGQSVREAAPYRGNAHGTYPDALPDLLTVLIVVIAPVGVDTVWPLPGGPRRPRTGGIAWTSASAG